MTLIELMTRLSALDIRLRLEDGALRFSAPDGAMTPELRDLVAARKPEIMTFLSGAAPTGDQGPRARAGDPTGTRRLSAAQERLWLLDRLDPGNSAFNMHAAVRFTGPLDTARLGRCLDAIVARHDILRTTFSEEAGHPVQQARPGLTIPLHETDLRGLPEDARREEARRLGEEESGRSFDLTRDALLRTTLLRLGDDEHVLLLTMHHIVSDGWSVKVVIDELNTLYGESGQHEAASVKPLPFQYADFADWQRERLTGEAAERQLAFWRDRLGGELPELRLPLDHPRPATTSYRGEQHRRTVPADVARRLRELGGGEGATPFITMLAAFELLLLRHSGQEDIVVGIPDAGRVHPETESLVGCFVNTLALRTGLGGDPSFRELLGRVRDTALDAYEHRDVPFERVLNEVQPERRLDRTPVFQVFFNMLPFEPAALRLNGVEAEIVTAPEVGAKFDLTLYVSGDGRELTLVHNADLFTSERAEEMLDQYAGLLAAVAADPDAPASAHSLVTEGARTVLPDPAAPLRRSWDGSLLDAFRAQAGRVPDRVAVTDPQVSWTYRQLADRAAGVAGRLRAAGIGSHDVVAVPGHRSAGLVAALLGIWGAGAAFLVLDPEEPPARLAEQVRQVGPKGWISPLGAGDELPSALREALDASAVRLVDEDPGTGVPRAFPGTATGPDDLAYVGFTSGSTGRPKGVLGPHGPLAHFVSWFPGAFGLTDTDRFALLSAPGHDPMLRDVFVPLSLGATLSVPDFAADGAGQLADWLTEDRITVAGLTPATLDFLLAGGEYTGKPNDVLRHVFLGGERLHGRHIERARRYAPGVNCVNVYGATETPQVMSTHQVQDPAGEIPVGHGIDGVQLLVTTPAGRQAGIGELGEIHVRTPYLAAGYLDDAALTAERFLTVPGDTVRRYRTGDLGRYLPDGAVQFEGRADRQVQIRGHRVEPAETEARLREHPAVADCAVVPDGEEGPGRRLVAHIVPAGDPAPTADELRTHARAALPAHMVPAVFAPIAALPVRGGKVDHAALPSVAGTAPEPSAAYTAPRDRTEELLTGIWADVLAVPRVGVHDNFFALGGHSLLATVITHRVREQFGVNVALRSLFEQPTVAGLAKEIAQQEPGTETDAPAPITAVARTEAGLDDLLLRLGDLTGAED